jgi:hypothetical protein
LESRTGENPPYGMIGRIEETSASFEARSAPRSYPTSIIGYWSPVSAATICRFEHDVGSAGRRTVRGEGSTPSARHCSASTRTELALARLPAAYNGAEGTSMPVEKIQPPARPAVGRSTGEREDHDEGSEGPKWAIRGRASSLSRRASGLSHRRAPDKSYVQSSNGVG